MKSALYLIVASPAQSKPQTRTRTRTPLASFAFVCRPAASFTRLTPCALRHRRPVPPPRSTTRIAGSKAGHVVGSHARPQARSTKATPKRHHHQQHQEQQQRRRRHQKGHLTGTTKADVAAALSLPLPLLLPLALPLSMPRLCSPFISIRNTHSLRSFVPLPSASASGSGSGSASECAPHMTRCRCAPDYPFN